MLCHLRYQLVESRIFSDGIPDWVGLILVPEAGWRFGQDSQLPERQIWFVRPNVDCSELFENPGSFHGVLRNWPYCHGARCLLDGLRFSTQERVDYSKSTQ